MSPKTHMFLFVCMGNICRSPALAAVLQKMIAEKKPAGEFDIDSCALTAWYLGCKADPRMCCAAKKHGISIKHRAKLFEESYFQIFDHIFAVSEEVQSLLIALARTPEEKAKIHLATKYSQKYPNADIPDPYYGAGEGFELVMDMAEDVCKGIYSAFCS